MSAAADLESFSVRPARPADHEEIVDLHLTVHSQLYAPPSLDVAKYAADARVRALKGPWRCSSIQVAEVRGRIVGYVDVVYDSVNALYVDQEAWRRGVGSALLDVAERQLRRKGVAVARLRVASAHAEIVDFYRKRGWRAGKDLGTDRTWDIGLMEMSKQLFEQSSFARMAPWLLFKLALIIVASSVLLLFGIALHDFLAMPSGITTLAVVLGGFMAALLTLRIRRLNLGLLRCCLVALMLVGSYLLVYMLSVGLGSGAMKFLFRADERYHESIELAGVLLFLMIAFVSNHVPRMARPLYGRLL